MIRRLYVHNFRCLENFEFRLDGQPSALLIGKNGSGKSTLLQALNVLRMIAQGTNRIKDLLSRGQLAWGRTDRPVRIELEVDLSGVTYTYSLALELPDRFHELRVAEETLTVDGQQLLSRSLAQVTLTEKTGTEARFAVDWHLVALPIISERRNDAPILTFRKWLSRMLLLAPVPALMSGDSEGRTLMPDMRVERFAEWFTGLLLQWPAAYTDLHNFVSRLMPEFAGFENREFSEDRRSLFVQFTSRDAKHILAFKELSDGEKCILVSALVNAAFQHGAATFCLWDEPDNFLAPSEVGHFVMDLRRAVNKGGQLLVTSHNPEAIRQFSNTNTYLLHRKSYMEPTQVRRLDSLDTLQRNSDLIETILLDDLEP